ncbi:hypothetical protein VTJ04DRAFT_2330 [Mycothermus thermophilus]|uniref:uncharacterized protein n=1 Tax=Humicola insolens TaxID=85995 RepID=UPI0037443E15
MATESATRRPSPERLPISTLSPPKREMLERAIKNIMSTDLCRETFAQVVDGLPLSHAAFEARVFLCMYHPLLNDHKELCNGVVDETEKLCSEIDIASLLVSAQALHNFDSVPPCSSLFAARFIEVVARAIHEVAVYLHKQSPKRHKDDHLGKFRPPEDIARFYPRTFPETLFCHYFYDHYTSYPNGVADCVGYWAEERIFGGVLVFDRRDPAKVEEASVSPVSDHPSTEPYR